MSRELSEESRRLAHSVATSIARHKAAEEAAEERARDEKRKRMASLYGVIMRPLEIDRAEQESVDTILFEYCGHQYRIEEIE